MKDLHYADWLRAQFIVHKDKNKADLARALGLEPPAISKILSGMRQIKAHEYSEMRRFFGLPVDGEKAISPQAGTHTHTHALNDPNDSLPADWVIPDMITPTAPQKTHKNVQNTYIVTDHLMAPDFARDETILVDPLDRTPAPAGAFVVSDRFSHMVRHCEIIVDSNPPEIRVSAHDQSFNAQVLKFDDFEIVGRVVGKVSWLT